MREECLHLAPMIGARPGELTEVEARALSTHLEACPTCQAIAADVTLTDGLLAQALLARANARDFAPFVDEVMERVSPRPPRRASLRHRAREHWKLLAFSAAALVLLAAGSVFMYVRSTVAEPERVAAVEMELQGGSTVLQTSDGPVVLLAPDDDTGS